MLQIKRVQDREANESVNKVCSQFSNYKTHKRVCNPVNWWLEDKLPRVFLSVHFFYMICTLFYFWGLRLNIIIASQSNIFPNICLHLSVWMYVFAYVVPKEVRRGHQITWNLSYRLLTMTLWILGVMCGYSEGVVSIFNLWNISPVQCGCVLSISAKLSQK